MTALLDDSWLLNIRPQPMPVTAEEYEALPEEIAKAIEIVDGYVAYCATPTPDHQTAARRLANMLERHAREAMSKGHECVAVNTSVDLRLGDQPLLNRRPDAALYRCLDRERDERLRAEWPSPSIAYAQPFVPRPGPQALCRAPHPSSQASVGGPWSAGFSSCQMSVGPLQSVGFLCRQMSVGPYAGVDRRREELPCPS
ncbi:Uma2 family endonuclease [Nonomuraea aurantiaca]|uniref:Uma2 family endonuclease n=1 Tax=Nonomuraea aurantiaca TaxID=2878562 RepID=UPI001CDA27C8|nr:Uma2 family endonuclease [Nonomuraea aurantiaca]MCA2222915.1 Uma2 family endonuclease [Nonomuraea aurantiaca]